MSSSGYLTAKAVSVNKKCCTPLPYAAEQGSHKTVKFPAEDKKADIDSKDYGHAIYSTTIGDRYTILDMHGMFAIPLLVQASYTACISIDSYIVALNSDTAHEASRSLRLSSLRSIR
ncbi:hypothetical protein PCH_Pc20g04650 [Penicillium rubens Wisconsin 54-1255]|uniref:Uncharacterized protein n=1 Tax=Penicillium rubens (strain ATCC 28089 / DSM 1075 / NRRL 1951 / Wisconsin 54-1255) TaxID=500485 RepID=B6HE35_PENRW|nr:hypothetical protein PCH_Pc20g04650 [Penicillium rubens Wisconsin 54-1255]